ncbi:hypothetical protein Ancab_029180 [Ancistrocladus abbreviatus]
MHFVYFGCGHYWPREEQFLSKAFDAQPTNGIVVEPPPLSLAPLVPRAKVLEAYGPWMLITQQSKQLVIDENQGWPPQLDVLVLFDFAAHYGFASFHMKVDKTLVYGPTNDCHSLTKFSKVKETPKGPGISQFHSIVLDMAWFYYCTILIIFEPRVAISPVYSLLYVCGLMVLDIYCYILLSDFNMVWCMEDKMGGNPLCLSRLHHFLDGMDFYGLSDLGFHGLLFTWEAGGSEGEA